MDHWRNWLIIVVLLIVLARYCLIAQQHPRRWDPLVIVAAILAIMFNALAIGGLNR